MKPHFKEYNFADWINLSDDIRREIQNHYWTPFDSAIGEKTRNGILEEFIKTIDKDYYLCEFRYIAHYVIGLNYIPKDSSKKVPKDFYNIPINKGKIIDYLNDNEVQVKWRFSGSEIMKLKEN